MKGSITPSLVQPLNNKKPEKQEKSDEQEDTELFDDMDLLHALIDNIPDHIYIKDRNSRFILANQKIAYNWGLKSGSLMVGKSDHDFYPKKLADKYYQNEQEIIRSGKSLIGIEEKTIDENGKEIFLSTTKTPLKDKKGNIIGIVGIGRDITDRKTEHAKEMTHINILLENEQKLINQQSEELAAQTNHLHETNKELQKLTVAISETDNVVLILDSEGNFEWVNKSFSRVYGLTLEELKKKHGQNIIEECYNPNSKEIMDRCRESGKTIRYQSETKNKEGEKIWSQSTLTPVFDSNNKIIRFVAIDANITALKMAEDMINKQKNELEVRGRQLEKANITKDKFFSIMAHDLKSPFNSILGFSGLISSNFNKIPDEKKREYLKLIHESTEFANSLLDNLLDWSRTQTDHIKYNPSNVELHSSVIEIRQMFHSSIIKKNIHFENLIPKNTYAWVDPNMFKTVLRNLIGNAIKFTPDNGTIELSIEASDDKIIVSLRDTGIGMSEEQQEKLLDFGNFYTTNGTGGEQGTGLGLMICHEFIKKHGGTLKLKSQPGKGTTFSFDIPAREK